MRLCLFDDPASSALAPLTLARPAFELVCGRFSLRERLIRFWSVSDWAGVVREDHATVLEEEFPEARFNDLDWLRRERTLCVLGRWIPEDLSRLPADGTSAFVCAETPVAGWFEPSDWDSAAPHDLAGHFERTLRLRRRLDAGGEVAARPWDLVEANARELTRDYDRFPASAGEKLPHGVELIGDPRQLRLAPRAEIEPFVVIDVRQGPVSIDSGARIKAFTRLEGPCHIGRESQLFRAQVSAGTTIGPVCRIGGEVENSIVHGWANKYHDGFLGHSYVCPWVNLGAQSGTSDLKFDYSPVRVPLSGELIETGLKKVGSFIGDHAKTAVNSLFDTGSSIGVMSLVLPDGDLVPRHIPSFARYWRGQLEEGHPLDVLFDIARMAMSRRGVEFTAPQEMLLRLIYDRTSAERTRAFRRMRETRPLQIHTEPYPPEAV